MEGRPLQHLDPIPRGIVRATVNRPCHTGMAGVIPQATTGRASSGAAGCEGPRSVAKVASDPGAPSHFVRSLGNGRGTFLPVSERFRSFPTRLEREGRRSPAFAGGEQAGLSPGVSEEANPSGPRTTPEIATPYYALILPRGQTIVIFGLGETIVGVQRHYGASRSEFFF